MSKNKYGDTPLHLSAQSSQTTNPVNVLLLDANSDALKMRNKAGYTPLDLALVSGACFSAIKLFVEKEPSLLVMSDEGGMTPTQLLWSSFQKNIPGLLAMKRYLKSSNGGEDEMGNILRKFWTKFKYCAIGSYRIAHYGHEDAQRQLLPLGLDAANDKLLCHAILDQGLKDIFVCQALAIALMGNTSLATQTDEAGDTPLHILAGRQNCKPLEIFLELCPSDARNAAFIGNKEGRMPLHIAMDGLNRLKRKGDDYDERKMVELILTANADALDYQDSTNEKDGLYPFMIAALANDLQLTYDMLLKRPLAGPLFA